MAVTSVVWESATVSAFGPVFDFRTVVLSLGCFLDSISVA